MQAPGSSGIEGEIRMLKQRISELERRAAPAPELAVVRLGANVLTAGGGDTIVSGAWSFTATVDSPSVIFRRTGTTYTMEKEPEYWNGTSYIPVATSHFRIPKSGRWHVEFNTLFNGPAAAGTVSTVGNHMRLNRVTAPVDNLIAQDARWLTTYAGFTPVRSVCPDRTFVAGDKIYFAAFSGSNQTIVPSNSGAFSYALIRYLGPN